MISPSLQAALNTQIKHEFFSSFQYLAMSAYFDSLSLSGFAKWMLMQSQEEHAHAMRLFNFVADRGGHVELQALEQPRNEFAGPLDVFQAALEHEQFISAQINSLYALAVEAKDYAAQVHLQWFIEEQAEEEKNASEIVDRLKIAGNDGSAILMLDAALGQRSAEDEAAA